MKNIFAILLTALGLNVTSCSQHDSIKSVSVQEFEKEIIENAVQLVDVRTPGEYSAGHIAYAMNIDVMSSSFSANVAKALNKQKPVYVYCRSGHRSMTAASVLAGEGFRVVNLSGGIMEWMGSGKAVSR